MFAAFSANEHAEFFAFEKFTPTDLFQIALEIKCLFVKIELFSVQLPL